MHVRWKAGRKKGTEKDQGSTQVKLCLPGTLYEIDANGSNRYYFSLIHSLQCDLQLLSKIELVSPT